MKYCVCFHAFQHYTLFEFLFVYLQVLVCDYFSLALIYQPSLVFLSLLFFKTVCVLESTPSSSGSQPDIYVEDQLFYDEQICSLSLSVNKYSKN